MIKRGIFATILVFLAIISIVSASIAITEKSGSAPQNPEAYLFDEPEDLDWNVRSHSRISFWCPEKADSFKIRQKIKSDFLNQLISNDEVQEFLEECSKTSFFYFKGRPLSSEMATCFNNLASAFPQVDFSTNPKIRNEIIRECYVREHFNQTFNGASSETSGMLNSLLADRVTKFVNFVNYEMAHPNERLPITEESGAGLIVNDNGRDIVNISCRREFGDECNKKSLPSDVGPEPAIN